MKKRGRSANEGSPRKHPAEPLARALELPPGSFTGLSQIALTGNREAVLEGCRGILSYSEEEIQLAMDNMVLCITGRMLRLRSMSDQSILIDGFIDTIQFKQ